MSRVCDLVRASFSLILIYFRQYYRRHELVFRVGVFFGCAPPLAGACEHNLHYISCLH